MVGLLAGKRHRGGAGQAMIELGWCVMEGVEIRAIVAAAAKNAAKSRPFTRIMTGV